MTTGEQQALMKLSMFRHNFTALAAEQVAGVNSRLLHELVGKSLLGSSSDGYYLMHDLVRQYSIEKLSVNSPEQEVVTQRYIEFFLGMVAGWSKLFKCPAQSATLTEGDKVAYDINFAWQLAVGHSDIVRLSQAMEGLMLYYSLRYRLQEGELACQVALDGLQNLVNERKCEALYGYLLAWRAVFYRLRGKIDAARQSLEVSAVMLKQAEAAGQDFQAAKALFWRERHYYAFELTEKLDYLNKSAAIYQQLGDAWSQAWVLSWAGEYANRLGNYSLALDLHQQAVALSRSAGDPRRSADALKFLGYDYLINGPWQAGYQYMQEAASYYRDVGDLSSLAYSEIILGASLGWTGRYQEGANVLDQALLKLTQLGDRFYTCYTMVGLGLSQLCTLRYSQAGTTLAKCLELTRQDGFQREEASCLTILGCLELIQGNPASALVNVQESVRKFRQMGFAGELSMALGGFALVEHILGHVQPARALFKEAIQIAVKSHSRFTLFVLPAPVIVILADNGYWEQAVEAYTVLMTDPLVANSRWFTEIIGNRMELARQYLPEATYQAAEARGRVDDPFYALSRLLEDTSIWDVQPAPG
jgi:tetratricopeptide (TPR) repeat protein